MIILNKPKCGRNGCGCDAITNINGHWLCGNHAAQAIKNLQQAQEEIMFKEWKN